MAIVVRFTPQGMTDAKYDECIKRLEAVRAGTPAGRLYHVCFGDPNNLNVSDIWDSVASFERFGQTLKPILQDLGIDPAEPAILEVHNIIQGVNAASGER